MGFKIVSGANGKVFWCAGDGASTYYVGQLVSYTAASKAHVNGTVVPLAVPAGEADTTNFQVLAGVVVGLNDRKAVSNSTGQYITGVTTQAAQLARDWAFQEGMYIKGDSQPLIQIAPINDETVIEGPIFNATLGVAPTVVADTAGDTTGYTTAGTTGACDFTPVASLASIYCRTGANAKQIRVTKDTSTTAPQTNTAFSADVAIGDTFVRVPLKQGFSKIYIAGPGLFIDSSKTPATHNFNVIVEDLNLREAGKETAQFRFTSPHFDFARA